MDEIMQTIKNIKHLLGLWDFVHQFFHDAHHDGYLALSGPPVTFFFFLRKKKNSQPNWKLNRRFCVAVIFNGFKN